MFDVTFFARHEKEPHFVSSYRLRLWWSEADDARHPAAIESAAPYGLCSHSILF